MTGGYIFISDRKFFTIVGIMLFKICIEKTLISTRAKFFMQLFTNIIIHKSHSSLKINFMPVPVNNLAHFFCSFFYVVFF